MYVSKTNLYLGGIIVGTILLYMNFFSLIEGLGSIDNLYWPFFLVFVVILASNIDPSSYYFVRCNSPFISRYVVGVGISLLVVVMGTTFTYGQSITRTMRELMPYTMFLLAIPMLMYILRKGTINGLFDILNIMSVVWFILIIVQRFVYSRSGAIIFSSAFEYQVRDGIRISLSCVGNLSLVINLYQLLYVEKEKRSKLVKTVCILGVYALLVIQQTRALTFAVSACFLVMVIFDKRKEVKPFTRKWIIVFAVLITLFSTGLFNSFFESFSTTGDYAHSTIVRTEAIDYYFSIFKKNPLFGFGLIGVADFESLIRGPYGAYYLDDVGIFGQLAKLGAFIIPIYIWPIMRFFKIAFETRREGYEKEFVLLITLCIYIVITSVSVIMLDAGRSIGMPIYITLFEYQHYRNHHLLTENFVSDREELDNNV